VKRLDFRLEDDLYEALVRQARAQGISKSELVRRFLREKVKPLPPIEDDPLWGLVGIAGDAEPADDIDEVIYGGKTRDRP
jgi:hypothetical protein